jgi:hypothetical protein
MKLSVVLLQAFLVTATLAQISISTPPSLAQCQAWTITWTGGTGESSHTCYQLMSAPYYIYIYPESYLDESSFLYVLAQGVPNQ